MKNSSDIVCKNIRKTAGGLEKILLSLNILLTNLSKIPAHDPKSHLPNTTKRLSTIRGPILNPTRRKLQRLDDNLAALGKHISELDTLNNSGQSHRETLRKDSSQYYLTPMYEKEVDDWNRDSKKAEVFKNNILVSFRINGELYRLIRGDRDISKEIAAILKEVAAFLAIIRRFR